VSFFSFQLLFETFFTPIIFSQLTRELTFEAWAETHVGVWLIVSVILVGLLPKLELVEIFHDNPFISTWVYMRKDRLGHGHDSYS